MPTIITSSIILLATTDQPNEYLFGAYKENGEATSFLKLPEDHRFFVDRLRGKQTVMGRSTLEATPVDFPDGGRICITHHPDDLRSDAIPAKDIQEAIRLAKKRAEKSGDDRIYVIGGASIIKQAIEKGLLDEINLTLTYGHQENIPHPVYLSFNREEWTVKKDSGKKISESSVPKNLAYRFLVLQPK